MTTLSSPNDPSRSYPGLPPLLSQLEGWLNNERPRPYLHINLAEPYSRYLLAALLPDAVYLRLTGRVTDLNALERQLEDGLAAYQRITQAAPSGRYLILDECDRVADEVVLSWLKGLHAAHDPRRVILMGRSTPIKLRRSPELADLIAFIPHTVSHAPSGQHALIVRAFGPGVVEVDGVRVEAWMGHQPHLLFFFIIDRAIVKRDEVFKSFWPNMTPHEATNVFHVTKNKITRALSGGSQAEFTKYEGQFYRIAPIWQISYDVSQFLALVQAAEGTTDPQVEENLLRQAEALYQGDYLSTFTEEWVVQQRQKLREVMADVLYRLAAFVAQRDDFDAAYTYIMRSYQCDRRRPELLLLALEVLPRSGRASDARTLYAAMRTTLNTPTPDMAARIDALRQTLDT